MTDETVVEAAVAVDITDEIIAIASTAKPEQGVTVSERPTAFLRFNGGVLQQIWETWTFQDGGDFGSGTRTIEWRDIPPSVKL